MHDAILHNWHVHIHWHPSHLDHSCKNYTSLLNNVLIDVNVLKGHQQELGLFTIAVISAHGLQLFRYVHKKLQHMSKFKSYVSSYGIFCCSFIVHHLSNKAL